MPEPFDLAAMQARYPSASMARRLEIQVPLQMSRDLLACLDEIDRMRATLVKLRRSHLVVDDCWYSCPKSGNCCDDRREGAACDCGADAANALIDALLPEG